MKAIYRTIGFSLIVPVLFLGVMCCHFSGMAMASQMSCCSVMSASTSAPQTHNQYCNQSQGTHKSKSCECFKISGIVDKVHSQSGTVSKTDFIPNHFVFASQAVSYLPSHFFNYQSPPKVIQNSPPFYLQVSVRPPPSSIL